MDRIDRYAHTNRWRHRSPVEKWVLGGGMLLLSLTLAPWPGAVLIAIVMSAFTLFGAGIPFSVYWKSIRLPGSFVLLSTVALLVSVSFDGGVVLRFAPEQAPLVLRLILRAIAAITCVYFLAFTTPVVELVATLRVLRFPAVVLELILLMYRLLFVFAETLRMIRLAQRSRLGYVNLRTAYRSSGIAVAALLTRALDRAARLETGLAARGYDGELRVLTPRYAFSVGRVLLALALEGGVLLAGLYGSGRWHV